MLEAKTYLFWGAHCTCLTSEPFDALPNQHQAATRLISRGSASPQKPGLAAWQNGVLVGTSHPRTNNLLEIWTFISLSNSKRAAQGSSQGVKEPTFEDFASV